MTEPVGERSVRSEDSPRAAYATSVIAGAGGGGVNFHDVHGGVNVYQGSSLTVPTAPSLNAAIISTTLLSATGTYRLDTAALPHAHLANIGSPQLSAVDRVRENLGLHVLAELSSPGDLPAALVATLGLTLSVGPEDESRLEVYAGASQELVESSAIDLYDELRRAWPTIRSSGMIPPEAMSFAEYAAFAEVVPVEESPARRTSAAAQAAATLSARIMTTGASATLCSAGLNGDHMVATVIVGSGATIVLSSAGAAVTLMSHWIGKRLNLS